MTRRIDEVIRSSAVQQASMPEARSRNVGARRVARARSAADQYVGEARSTPRALEEVTPEGVNAARQYGISFD